MAYRAALTENEIEEMRQAWRNRAEGETAVDVARRLGMSPATLRRYIPSARGLSRAHKGFEMTDGLEAQRRHRSEGHRS
jgi:hypothetical protein